MMAVVAVAACSERVPRPLEPMVKTAAVQMVALVVLVLQREGTPALAGAEAEEMQMVAPPHGVAAAAAAGLAVAVAETEAIHSMAAVVVARKAKSPPGRVELQFLAARVAMEEAAERLRMELSRAAPAAVRMTIHRAPVPMASAS